MNDTVRLSVPADPSYARPVRMMAANLAVLAGFSLDDVEDARMAVEEGFVWCCATSPEVCEVSFDVSEDRIRAEFALGPADPLASGDPAYAYAELILASVCDEYELDPESGRLVLVKHRGELDA